MPSLSVEDWPEVTKSDVDVILASGGCDTGQVHALPPDQGSPRRTHVFVFDRVVVKLDQQQSGRIERERAALELLECSNLPVPRLVAAGQLEYGRPWILMT